MDCKGSLMKQNKSSQKPAAAAKPAPKNAAGSSKPTRAVVPPRGEVSAPLANGVASAAAKSAPLAVSLAPSASDKLSQRALLILLALGILAFIPIIRSFLVPVLMAASFTTLFYPIYTWIARKPKVKPGFASLLTCLIILLGFLIPAYLVIHLATVQTIEMYASAGPFVQRITAALELRLQAPTLVLPLIGELPIADINWGELINNGISTLGRLGGSIVNKTSAGLFSVLGNIFIMLFVMFYLFIDGERLLLRLKFLSPLKNEYEEMLYRRFVLISRATVKGTLLIGLVQGSLGALTLLFTGVQSWLLWGFVMVILSIIPMVGAWLVLIPAGIVQILLGHPVQGVVILLASTLVISNIDNLLRPRLVGRDAKMHDLLIFFSTLGGISVFGIFGFIIGPVIASFFLSVLDIYGLEFHDQLHSLEQG